MDLYEKIISGQEKIAIIGLGYVGFPVAMAFSKKAKVIGFDIDKEKITAYQLGKPYIGYEEGQFDGHQEILFTHDPSELRAAKFIIVCVPTPINNDKTPNLAYLENASKMIGHNIQKGSIVVYESTVYPGVTEEVCLPLIEKTSGLTAGKDFKVAYSPERINPGDTKNKFETIVKIVSGMDQETLMHVADVYELVLEHPVYRAESIKIAEAAKVIENAQRDINIAFMNELSMLFQIMNLDTQAVIKAASTKWNFMPFSPGLVGGHCIGIDPYYLTYKAEGAGYHSQIILAGRQVNDAMGKYVAQQVIKLLIKKKVDTRSLKMGILGFSYKENGDDFRNTKVADIYGELQDHGFHPVVIDPLVNQQQVKKEYGIELMDVDQVRNMDVLILAVPHDIFKNMRVIDYESFYSRNSAKFFIDIKGVFNRDSFEPKGFTYWSL